jgi:hypothetical protein
MTADTDIVDKHDNPWVQIEQLQMEIERLKAIIHEKGLWDEIDAEGEPEAMTELVGGGYERLQMQLMVANDQLKEKDKEIERLTNAWTDLVKASGDMEMSYDSEIERLRELLEEAAEELTTIFDMAYPDRTDYPDEMRRWKRDMDLVYRIKDTIRNQKP